MTVYLAITIEPDSEVIGIFSTREKAEEAGRAQPNPDWFVTEHQIDGTKP